VITLFRQLPIFLICSLGGTIFVVLNTGLYWDDWVWFYQSPEENLKIGRELGIWWAGYVSNAIYALPHPTLTLRLAALLAWAVSALAFAHVLRQTKLWNGESLFPLVLLYCAIHICLIRFLNSVAFYNIYIASFWIGAALFVGFRGAHLSRWFCLPFFYFGFYLSSTFAFYGLGLAILFHTEFSTAQLKQGTPRGYRVGEFFFNANARETYVRSVSQSLKLASRTFFSRYWLLLLLPVCFFLLRRLTREPSDFYRGYNAVEGASTVQGIRSAWSVMRVILKETFSLAWSNVPGNFFVFVFLLVLVALLLVKPFQNAPSGKILLRRAVLGLMLVFLGVLPYLVAGKPPKVGDFYESRHLMTSVPGIVMLIWTGINFIAKAFGGGLLFRSVRLFVLTGVLALFLSQSTVFAVNLWSDRFLQMAITHYLKDNQQKFDACRTIIVLDGTEGYRLGNRKIWNYEYTGYLVQHYGSKERLGISAAEYIDWPKKVPLVRDPAYRKRYNLDELDFKACHAVITIENARAALKVGPVARIVLRYLAGQDVTAQIEPLFYFFLSFEKIEFNKRIEVINEAMEYLSVFYRANGFYPTSEKAGEFDANRPSTMSVPSRGLSELLSDRASRTNRALINAVPGFEEFQSSRGRNVNGFAIDFSEKGRFQYISDGLDYKLIYVDPVDLPYVKQVSPELVDYVRPGYGVWTRGAASW
jgi:hypothetical protein